MDKADFLKQVQSMDKYGWIGEAKTTKRVKARKLLAGESELNEINQFFERYNREPNEANSMEELVLQTKLNKLRRDKLEHLRELDAHNLVFAKEQYTSMNTIQDIVASGTFARVTGKKEPKESIKTMDDVMNSSVMALIAGGVQADNSIFNVTNVSKDSKQTRRFRDKGKRSVALDFDSFEPLFKDVHQQLSEGTKKLVSISDRERSRGENMLTQDNINEGNFYLVKGMLAYVAEVGESVQKLGGDTHKLRIIYENGSQSNMTRRSFSVRLRQDGGHSIESEDGKAFNAMALSSGKSKELSGYVYIARTTRNVEGIDAHKHLFKIGMTKRDLVERFKDAERDPAFLHAKAERMRVIPVFGLDPKSVEGAFHSLFEQKRIDVTYYDNDGHQHKATEWFHLNDWHIETAIGMARKGVIHKRVLNRETNQFESR